MAAPPLSPRPAVSDRDRLAAVASYGLVGHAGDPDLECVVEHMATVIGAPIAVINLVSPDQQCYPAERGVGAAGTAVPDEVSFCAYVVAEREPLSVADARAHPVFSANPLVAAGAITAYLGVPLVDEDGFVLGALSVFDSVPREFTAEELDVLQVQVRLVRALLSLRRRVAAHEWSTRLLAAQSRVLEAVATGRPLAGTLSDLDAAAGDLSARASSEAERRTLRETVQRLARIAEDTDGWRRDIERLAQQDALTGLASRAHFVRVGGEALVAGGAVLFVDLDRFKEVNDRGGHALGDQLLVRLAERLSSRVTTAVRDAVVGRLGGDEFAAVLPGVDEVTAARLGEDLVEALVDAVPSGRRTISVSASIGLAMAGPGEAFDAILRDADTAMYRAKALGRRRLHVLRRAAPLAEPLLSPSPAA